MKSVFLSTSIPDTSSPYYKKCDPLLIQSALRSFLFLVLGRKHLVLGGHPSITPLILAACEDLKIQNKNAVTLFQSKFYESVYPQETMQFANLVETPKKSDSPKSLGIMRKRMFSAFEYEAAIFLGGKEGILEEHSLFTACNPLAKIVTLKTPGGAAAEIKSSASTEHEECDELLDYVGAFTHSLKLDLSQKRNLIPPKPLTPKNTNGMDI